MHYMLNVGAHFKVQCDRGHCSQYRYLKLSRSVRSAAKAISFFFTGTIIMHSYSELASNNVYIKKYILQGLIIQFHICMISIPSSATCLQMPQKSMLAEQ